MYRVRVCRPCAVYERALKRVAAAPPRLHRTTCVRLQRRVPPESRPYYCERARRSRIRINDGYRKNYTSLPI